MSVGAKVIQHPAWTQLASAKRVVAKAKVARGLDKAPCEQVCRCGVSASWIQPCLGSDTAGAKADVGVVEVVMHLKEIDVRADLCKVEFQNGCFRISVQLLTGSAF